MHYNFNNPFNEAGNWYKGNLHLHTTNSDGALSPLEMIKQYQKKGFHFLSITDHNKLTEVKKVTELLLIKGEELDCVLGKDINLHLVALNIKEEIKPPSKDNPQVSLQHLIDKIRSRGGEVILAHPYWSALSTTEILSLKDYIGVEVYNAYAQISVEKGYSITHWDNLLTRGKKIFGFAVDDSHWHFHSWCPDITGNAWIMAKVKKLTTESIMQSICKGLFYASCGPTIKNVAIEKDKIYVSTSPVKSISFIGPNGYGQMFSSVRENYIENAEYELGNCQSYIRIQCRDEKGRMAWTNPIFFGGQ